jgi:hypothetical protein
LNTERHWLVALRVYLAITVAAHLIWEVAQLPLYTIWSAGPPQEIAFAVLHCTVGDLMIATLSLVVALVCFGGPAWPRERFIPVMAATLVIGIAYTVYSEYLNTAVRKTWAYSELMPTVPPLGTGLSPLLQWVVVPIIGFTLLRHWVRRPQP